MPATIRLGSIAVDVLKKDIKNVHLSVHPPEGRVRISAPHRMDLDTIRVFAISKLPWIKKQQRKLQEQERESPRVYVDNESHFVWGRRYLLKVIELDEAPEIRLEHRAMRLRVRPGTRRHARQAILDEWYRNQIREAAPAVISNWTPRVGVGPDRLFVQRMKTKWGSCNSKARRIRLNSELAKKPRECLEYIIVHELVHLLHPKHDDAFYDTLGRLMPNWRFYRDTLNQLPVRHEQWDY